MNQEEWNQFLAELKHLEAKAERFGLKETATILLKARCEAVCEQTFIIKKK